MKIIVLLFSFAMGQACIAQIRFTKLDKNSVPKAIHYAGNMVQAMRWVDKTGDNIVILSKEYKNATGGTDGALYAYHYLVSGDSVKQTWRVNDFLKECSVDMFLYFVDKTFTVTDLNKDGKGEVWIMYKVSCQGDVSPVPMKIIMYEDNKKFAVRGATRVGVSGNESIGGGFTFDEAFKNAPPEFRQYAKNLWNKNKVENWKQ